MGRIVEYNQAETGCLQSAPRENPFGLIYSRLGFIYTNLSQANLKEANLNDAQMAWTILGSNDLSEVSGLESVIHSAPSEISISTIYQSGGNIPEVFLRGCGVPDTFITFARSLVGKAIEFYSCFISYSHADKSFAHRLHDQLQARGIRCWLDEHQLLPGHDIHDEVDRGIRLYDKVLLCCSKDSLASWWVDKEIATAFDKCRFRRDIEPFSALKLSHSATATGTLVEPIAHRITGGKDAENGSGSRHQTQSSCRTSEHSPGRSRPRPQSQHRRQISHLGRTTPRLAQAQAITTA